MKKIFRFVVFYFLLSGFSAMAQKLEDFKKIQVPVFSLKPPAGFKAVSLSSTFAKDGILKSKFIDSLKDKKIYSIRLVYTKYRESESFDQEKLNRDRIANLIEGNEAIFSNSGIKWYSVEQTDEDTSKVRAMFHGFFIVYKNTPPQREYLISEKLLNSENISTQKYSFKNTKDTILSGMEGTLVCVPFNCFLDKNNKPFKGDIVLELKEAVSMESIVTGNMLTISDGNALESGGMIYIDAKSKDGVPLKLRPNKSLKVAVKSNSNTKPDMQIWEADKSGKLINWVNPRSLNQDSVNKKQDRLANPQELNLAISRDYKDVRELFIESLEVINFNDARVDDRYLLYRDGKIKVQLVKRRGDDNEIVIADTIYDGKPFHNQKIALPVPACGKKYKFQAVYYKDKSFFRIGQLDVVPVVQDLQASSLYNFTFTKIGTWANIDRLARDSRTRVVDFKATLANQDSFSQISMYLIFKDTKMFIPAFRSYKKSTYGFSHGDFEVPMLPVGASATVLCICYKNDKPYIDIKNIVISSKQDIVLSPTASTEKDIKKTIVDTF